MEVIGAAASVFSLVQIVGSIQKSVQFLLKYHNSTSDFRRLTEQIENLTAKLRLLNVVEQWAAERDSSLQRSDLAILESSLQAAQKDISHARDVCLRYGNGKGGISKRLKWAIRDGYIWNQLASRLQDAQSSMALMIQILDLSVSSALSVVTFFFFTTDIE